MDTNGSQHYRTAAHPNRNRVGRCPAKIGSLLLLISEPKVGPKTNQLHKALTKQGLTLASWLARPGSGFQPTPRGRVHWRQIQEGGAWLCHAPPSHMCLNTVLAPEEADHLALGELLGLRPNGLRSVDAVHAQGQVVVDILGLAAHGLEGATIALHNIAQ